MAQKISNNLERSRNGVEAYEAAFGKDTRGREWNYIPNGGAITGVMIGYHLGYKTIGSIAFQSVDKNGNIEFSDVFGSYHGIGAGDTVFKVIFDWPREYLTSVKGTFHDNINSTNASPSSISFQTNKKTYGPFKPPNASLASSFDFQLGDRVIVGFYGREYYDGNGGDKHLISGLGVYTKHSHEISKVPKPIKPQVGSFDPKDCIKSGLWGWSGSIDEEWTYILKGPTDIKIGYNDKYIQSISFKSACEDDDSEFEYAQKSDTGVVKQQTISLNFPKEHLIGISGTTRTLEEDIESICLYTNRKIYGPFGSFRGKRFRFYTQNGSIVGFHGRVGKLFSALGVYTKSYSESSGNDNNDSIKEKPIEKIEARGGQEGKEWDYQPKGAITEIKIKHGWVIDSLLFKSIDGNNTSKYSEKYGGSAGDNESVVSINWPNEYLTSISGTLTTFENQNVVGSLRFHTNKGTYPPLEEPPFGREKGTHFDISLKDGAIVGFHGRHGNYINAIGVYHQKNLA